jgi:hypothetical protein
VKHQPYCQLPDGTITVPSNRPAGLLAGSFRPLHHGHRELAKLAAARLGVPVHFELSLANVDKPPLDDRETAERLKQFLGFAPVWVTKAPTFREKSKLFPGATFVLGFDTASRLVDPKYYGGDVDKRDAALIELQSRQCRLLVAGRCDHAGEFRIWTSHYLDEQFQSLFEVVTEAEFRVDISSTKLRELRSGVKQ